MAQDSIAIILIGRNEGERLENALASIPKDITRRVYVDSGSTDNSVAHAQAAGALVVSLDMTQPFTAARARNAGLEALKAEPEPPEFVQFIDGDCALQPGWITTAVEALRASPGVAVVCGRRRERFPEATLYNGLIDQEWDTPIGEAKACGGDAMMRFDVLQTLGGYDPTLIAGEEPELCVRMRQAGWKIRRLDAEMTLHDADITRFGQWWKRAKRAGFAYAQGAVMHGAPPELHCVDKRRRAILWGAVLPLTIIMLSLIFPWALALILIWPAQVLRLVRKNYGMEEAVFLTLAKFPEATGIASYYWRRWKGGPAALIEYK